MSGYIHSLETFGTVDGPGVRFVVFFEGCPMRCQYCHNPDTWHMQDGTKMQADEIIEKMERNRSYYATGGITATGGEPMMQLDFLLELFTKAKEKGIPTCLDTSGIMFPGTQENVLCPEKIPGKEDSLCPEKVPGMEDSLCPEKIPGKEDSLCPGEKQKKDRLEKIACLMEVTDLVMLDIKHIDDTEHRKLTGQSNQNILSFAKYLDSIGKPVWIRHVVVPGITLEEHELKELGRFLSTLSNVEKLEVLPYHSLGKVKYDNLGIEYPLKDTPQTTKEQAAWAREQICSTWKREKTGEN